MSWLKRGYESIPRHSVKNTDATWAEQHVGERTDVECPVCGEDMRIQKRKRDGVPFLGCTTFPNCKGVLHAWGTDGSRTCTGRFQEDEDDQDYWEW